MIITTCESTFPNSPHCLCGFDLQMEGLKEFGLIMKPKGLPSLISLGFISQSRQGLLVGAYIPCQINSFLLQKAENCSGFPHEKARDSAFDMDCREKYPTLCQVLNQLHSSFLRQVERAPQFLLRGLPPSAWFDQMYSLNEDLHNGSRQFVGPSGWMIRWDGARWVLECQR